MPDVRGCAGLSISDVRVAPIDHRNVRRSLCPGAQQKKGHYVQILFLACLGRRGDCRGSRPYDDFRSVTVDTYRDLFCFVRLHRRRNQKAQT